MRNQQVWLAAALWGIASTFGPFSTPVSVWATNNSPSAAQTAKREVEITEPKDRATVPERPSIEGKVTDPSADVWVVVHPTEVADYWVQPRLTVRRDGTWRLSVYIGRPGNGDVGKHFEIMAIANPKHPLKEGDVLRFWPDAELKSEVVEVTRK